MKFSFKLFSSLILVFLLGNVFASNGFTQSSKIENEKKTETLREETKVVEERNSKEVLILKPKYKIVQKYRTIEKKMQNFFKKVLSKNKTTPEQKEKKHSNYFHKPINLEELIKKEKTKRYTGKEKIYTMSSTSINPDLSLSCSGTYTIEQKHLPKHITKSENTVFVSGKKETGKSNNNINPSAGANITFVNSILLGGTPTQITQVESDISYWINEILTVVNAQNQSPYNFRIIFAPLSGNLVAQAITSTGNSDNVSISGLVPNTFYPSTLMESIGGSNVNGQSFDIEITIDSTSANLTNGNIHFSSSNTPAPSGKIHIASLIQHEITHGLGFNSGAQVGSTGLGFIGYSNIPYIYERFLSDSTGLALTDYTNALSLGSVLTGGTGAVVWNGNEGITNNGGNNPLIYSPNNFTQGSSISHLDNGTYTGTLDQLMTPILSNGQTPEEIGPITRGMLKDIGWNPNIFVLPIINVQSSLDFGLVNLNSGTAQSTENLVVTNTGGVDLTISNLNILGSQNTNFTTNTGLLPITISPNSTANIQINFTSNNLGIHNAQLEIVSNDPINSVEIVSLSADVQMNSPIINTSSSTIDFGTLSALPGNTATSSETLTVSNVGTQTLEILSASINGQNASNFSLSNFQPFSLINPNQTLDIQIDFTSSVSGNYSANLVLNTNDPNATTVIIPMSAEVLIGNPEITTSQESFDFGSFALVYSGQSVTSSKTLTITNTGTGSNLILNDLRITPNLMSLFYSVSNPSNVTELTQGESVNLQIDFNSGQTGKGNFNANLEILSNDPNTPTKQIPLSTKVQRAVTGKGVNHK